MKYFKLFWVFIFFYSINVFAIPGAFTSEFRKSIEGGSLVKNIVGDFNGDRISDIAYYKDATHINIIYSTYDGFLPTQSLTIKRGNGAASLLTSSNLYAGDFNGDGYDDILIYSGTDLYISLTGIQLDGSFTFRGYNFWISMDTDKLLIADFNGDGLDEVLCHNKTNAYQWDLLYKTSQDYLSFSKITNWYNSAINTITDQFVGDFNGDGQADKLRYNAGAWYVALSTGSGLGSESNWLAGHNVTKTSTVLIGDFNGDSKDDICYHIPTNNIWNVMTSNPVGSNGFNWEWPWSSYAGVNAGVYAGDFDGDGLCDKVTYISSSLSQWQGWWVQTSINQNPREVGVIYEATNYWPWKDPQKSPVAGMKSSSPIIMNSYSIAKPVFEGQVHDMKWCGLDFMIMNVTNGYSDVYPPAYKNGGLVTDTSGNNSLCKAFEYMKQRKDSLGESGILKIGIMLGLEFWDIGQFGAYNIAADGTTFWGIQKQRQNNAFVGIDSAYLTNSAYRPIYYNHLGKPLFEFYYGNGKFYPMTSNPDAYFSTDPYTYLPKFYKPNITARYITNNEYSYSFFAAGFRDLVPGMAEQGLWGLGAGPDWRVGQDLPLSTLLPPSKEMMTVMPGIYYWHPTATDKLVIKREDLTNSPQLGRGAYYKKSWCDVLTVMPQKVTITSWNAYCEESAIEATYDNSIIPISIVPGWGDLYLKLTKYYTHMFKHNVFFPDSTIYFKIRESASTISDSFYCHIKNEGKIYHMVNVSKVKKDSVLLIPRTWLTANSYNQGSRLNKESLISFNYDLSQNYPNPFNPETEIKFQIPENGKVSLKVYDILGREVAVLINDYREMGKYSVNFNASKYASGVYFYRLEVNDFVSTKKMMLLK